MPEETKILHLPGWYPSPKDPLNGIFIQNHVCAINHFNQSAVLHVEENPQLEITYSVKSWNDKGFGEWRSEYYPKQNGPSWLRGVINFFRYLKAAFRGYEAVRKQYGTPDLLHVHVMSKAGMLAFIKSIWQGKPYVISEHWSGYMNGHFKSADPFFRALSHLLVKGSQRISVPSQSLKNALLKIWRDKEVWVIPNVVKSADEGYKEELSKEKNATPQIISICDLNDPIKNISGVLEAIKEISREGYSLVYHIIGGGPDKEKLKQRARELEINGDIVQFHGPQPLDVTHDYLKKADFLLLNSGVETFSIVVAEALLMGKPVIATRCGGPEMMVNEKNGILIDPDNQNQLKNAIQEMLENYHSYDPVEIKESVKGNFDSKSVGERFKEFYQG